MTLTIGQAAQAALVVETALTQAGAVTYGAPILLVSIEPDVVEGIPVVWIHAGTRGAAERLADALDLTSTRIRRIPHEDDHLWWGRVRDYQVWVVWRDTKDGAA